MGEGQMSSGWTMSNAMGRKKASLTVRPGHGVNTTAIMERMLMLFVQVTTHHRGIGSGVGTGSNTSSSTSRLDCRVQKGNHRAGRLPPACDYAGGGREMDTAGSCKEYRAFG